MANVICVNNAVDPRLVAGTHILGTNYQCLRKGIGRGRNMPIDPAYAGPYVPIDGRRFYCGTNDILPPGYFAIGSASKCVSKGIGIGKAQRAAAAAVAAPPIPPPPAPPVIPPPIPPSTGLRRLVKRIREGKEGKEGKHVGFGFNTNDNMEIIFPKFTITLILCVLWFLFLYIFKPKYILIISGEKNRKDTPIDWYNFLLYYILGVLGVIIIQCIFYPIL